MLTLELRQTTTTSLLQNPVAAGSAVGLGTMLVLSAGMDTYEHAGTILGALGQGTFIGMASTDVLRSPAEWVPRPRLRWIQSEVDSI